MARQKATNRYGKVYEKELKRIQKTVDKLLRQGYAVEDVIPKTPKTITKKDVERLRNIKSSDIQKTAESLTRDTSTRYRSKKRDITKKRKKGKKQKSTEEFKPTQADIIIENFISTTYTYFPVAERMCRQWLENSLKKYGKEKTADALANTDWLTIHQSYDAESNGGHTIVPEFLSDMSSRLGLSRSEQIEYLASFDYENGWSEY